jgi:hypothetical protein
MSWRDRDLDREIENLHAKCERLQAQQRSRSAASDWTVILSRLDVGFAKLEACYRARRGGDPHPCDRTRPPGIVIEDLTCNKES